MSFRVGQAVGLGLGWVCLGDMVTWVRGLRIGRAWLFSDGLEFRSRVRSIVVGRVNG